MCAEHAASIVRRLKAGAGRDTSDTGGVDLELASRSSSVDAAAAQQCVDDNRVFQTVCVDNNGKLDWHNNTRSMWSKRVGGIGRACVWAGSDECVPTQATGTKHFIAARPSARTRGDYFIFVRNNYFNIIITTAFITIRRDKMSSNGRLITLLGTIIIILQV